MLGSTGRSGSAGRVEGRPTWTTRRGGGGGSQPAWPITVTPRWPCPPRLASLALLHCWLRAGPDGAHRDCCQTPGVESQLLLPQTLLLSRCSFGLVFGERLGSFLSERACGGDGPLWGCLRGGGTVSVLWLGWREIGVSLCTHSFQTWLPALAE